MNCHPEARLFALSLPKGPTRKASDLPAVSWLFNELIAEEPRHTISTYTFPEGPSAKKRPPHEQIVNRISTIKLLSSLAPPRWRVPYESPTAERGICCFLGCMMNRRKTDPPHETARARDDSIFLSKHFASSASQRPASHGVSGLRMTGCKDRFHQKRAWRPGWFS
jgi:hypothetical protein